MALGKTELGRAVLQAHATSDLCLAERRVLILCDGRRSQDDVVALLGADARGMIERLLRRGYLTPAAATPVSGRVPATVAPLTAASVAGQTFSVQVPAPPVAASRRSLAASKMYLLDMLQLQRDPGSASLRMEIQASPNDDDLVYRMMKAVHHLQSVASASFARRIGERLGEVLPEALLPRLEQIRVASREPESSVA